LSIERLNPLKSYCKENIVLIVVGLNSQPNGQFLNSHLTDNQRHQALEVGKFNQEYWNLCTKMSSTIFKKCEEARVYGQKILMNKMKTQIF
jgi:hypothetical protein